MPIFDKGRIPVQYALSWTMHESDHANGSGLQLKQSLPRGPEAAFPDVLSNLCNDDVADLRLSYRKPLSTRASSTIFRWRVYYKWFTNHLVYLGIQANCLPKVQS